MTLVDLLTALAIAIGLAGILAPILPGTLLILVAMLVWALSVDQPTGWVVFAVATTVIAAGTVIKFAIPGKHMSRAGVSNSTLLIGAALGIVGFFVIPVIGGPIGFVLGIFLIETGRSRDRSQAWRQTKVALRGVLQSIGIELLAGTAILATWIAGVLITR